MLTSEYIEALIQKGNKLSESDSDTRYIPYYQGEVRELLSTVRELTETLEALHNGI